MNILRTPDEHFSDLSNFPFKPNYIEGQPEFHGCRIHYLDEGPKDAAVTWLCLHGEPSWSYLYRKMIPVFTAAGHRVVAPDLIGFGKSDKPDDDTFYRFEMHRNMLLRFIDQLELNRINLVCQDWGGLLGLTLPMDREDLFKGLLVMNTALGTGDIPLGDGFTEWRSFVKSQPDLNVGALMKRSIPMLSEEEVAAYAAPFPDHTYKAGVRQFPQIVPEHFDDPGAELSRRARSWWENEWQGKSLMAIGMQDPVLGQPAMMHLHKSIKGCPPPIEIADGGHFVQELGEEIAEQAISALS